MRRFLGTNLVALLLFSLGQVARSADDGATAVIDKGIKALGGEAKLSKGKAIAWKTKGKIHFGDNENSFTGSTTIAGLDRFRGEFEGEFGGNSVKGVTVLNGDKGWRKFGDMSSELDKEGLANEKRTVYLQVVAATLLPLKGKDFQVEAAGEEKVGDADAVGVKVTPPDGKEFKLYFDKTSGLPVKLVAKIVGFTGDELTQETTYENYKDIGGIKKALKVDSKHNGERFLEAEISDFELLEKVDDKLFAEP
ncbi:MAG TPA: hypothetical protein VND64_19455 [Pirellulales bacterium]|nr:hypothetical protein [Pirellulales bacterium]